MSVARTGLPPTHRTPHATMPGAVAVDAALDRTTSGNGHRTPNALALTVAQDRTTGADQDPGVTPDARQQVRALVARERAGGPKVTAAEVIAATGRSRRRAYNCSSTPAPSRSKRPWTCASSTAPAQPAGPPSASPTTPAASATLLRCLQAGRLPYCQRKRREQEARRRTEEEARRRAREEQARRACDRTRHTPPPHAGTSRPGPWCGSRGGHRGPHTLHHDQAAHDRARRRHDGLHAKAAATGFPEEAAACRAKAEQLGAKDSL